MLHFLREKNINLLCKILWYVEVQARWKNRDQKGGMEKIQKTNKNP